MAWPQARAQIIVIFEETTGLLQKRGLSPSFKYLKEQLLSASSRVFKIKIVKMAALGNNTESLPVWQRFTLLVSVFYEAALAEDVVSEAIAADHLALTKRLRNVTLWGQPESTIENLWLGGELIVEAEVDTEKYPGAIVVEFTFTAEFRET